MKRFILCLLAISVILCMVGCNQEGSDASDNSQTENSANDNQSNAASVNPADSQIAVSNKYFTVGLYCLNTLTTVKIYCIFNRF